MGAAGAELFCEIIIFFCMDGETEVIVKGKGHSYKNQYQR